jgi:hypothetical protein
MTIKNQRIATKNKNSIEKQRKGQNWFNGKHIIFQCSIDQHKEREKLINIKNFKNNMIFRRSGATPNNKQS